MRYCFYDFEGKIITQDDQCYEVARLEWNRAIDKYPLIIAYCACASDVQEAIRWSRKYQIPIRIRSDGHNYENYSIGNCVLVIDVSRINTVEIDERRKLVKVGGGWGLSARYFGLGCDSLLELQLVDANGHLITANEHHNRELFWACQGAGGGNFGVVVSMTFRLLHKVRGVTFFELYAGNAIRGKQKAFLSLWQRWIREVPSNINILAGIYNEEQEAIYIYGRGICYGSIEETRNLLKPFYRLCEIQMVYGSFFEAITKIQASYPSYEYFKSTGRFVDQLFDEEEIESLLDIVNSPRPKGSILTSIGVYGLGGKTQEKRPMDTAFYYRDADYILNMQSVWEDNLYKKANVRWVEEYFPNLYQLTEGSYVNFPYAELKHYGKEYFGKNKQTLQSIKSLYDPENVFSFSQSIQPLY